MYLYLHYYQLRDTAGHLTLQGKGIRILLQIASEFVFYRFSMIFTFHAAICNQFVDLGLPKNSDVYVLVNY